MKSAQYAKYFIRIILAICVMAIIFTIFHIFTPKIDVFSSVGVHWLADKPQEVTCTFNPENFVEEVLQVKPRANLQDVENLAKSIQVQVDIIDSPEGVDDPYRIILIGLDLHHRIRDMLLLIMSICVVAQVHHIMFSRHCNIILLLHI